jgi:hypothetical protein
MKTANLCVGAVRQVNDKRRSRLSIKSSLSLSLPPVPFSLSRARARSLSVRHPPRDCLLVFVWFVKARKIAQHVLPHCFHGEVKGWSIMSFTQCRSLTLWG